MFAPVADTRKSWGGIFGLLGMDSENTGEFKHVCSRKEGPLRFLLSLFWSPLGKKANDQSLFSLKKNLMLPTGGPYPRHYFLKHKKKKKNRTFGEDRFYLPWSRCRLFCFIFYVIFTALWLNQYKYQM